ncbi:MAG: hypothetical protein K1X67_04405 [Fimbriimonadaceae bacterium]|nr:hypothetical protein [Fimbriimonadaceae bacterium]
MATQDEVRRIASRLPGAVEGSERFGFSVEVKGKFKGFVWSWAERVDPRKARVINDEVLAVMVPNLTTKDMLIAAEPDKFFTEPHYNAFPAVLVRLDAIAPGELEDLIVEAWRTKAPASLQRELDGRGE